MKKTLDEIARIVNGELVGDAHCIIENVSGIKEAKCGDLTFVAESKYFPLIKDTKASAILMPRGTDFPKGVSAICVDNPSRAFANIASIFIGNQKRPESGIHPTALISESAKIGNDVYVGPYVVIEDEACLGNGTTIHSGCFIGYNTTLGKECFVHPNTTIRERIKIGDRVIIHSGTVIGSDGFGFINVEGVHEKIPQIGTVVIEDDVEIGSNVTIDRARFDKTFIGKGTKIDNLVQIAHNVVIGEGCIIVSQVGISGSVTVEKGAILAGQAGIAGHLTIGEGAIVAAQGGVTKSVPAHTRVSGYPAKPDNIAKRVNASMQRLPHYVEIIRELKKRVEILESKMKAKTSLSSRKKKR